MCIQCILLPPSLHAQVSSPVLRPTTSNQISEQDNHNKASQSTAHCDRHNIRSINGITVLGQVISIRLAVVERLPLRLGHGHLSRDQFTLVPIDHLSGIQHLLAIAVVGLALGHRVRVVQAQNDGLLNWKGVLYNY